MSVDQSAPDPGFVPLRWSTERYLALVESGVIEDGRGIELIDGQIVVATPQGELHYFVFYALQGVLAAMGAFDKGLVSRPTVVLRDGDTYDPEFALLRPEAIGRRGLPTAADLLWTVEVSVSSLRTDLSVKKAAYAAAGVPHYWVVDAVGRGVWAFSEPLGGEYGQATFVQAEGSLPVPTLEDRLRLEAIVPVED
jgi:Uma2 family endonuclease